MKRSVAVFALVLAACSGSDKYDPTASWSAEKLYTEAKDALSDGKYDQVIKYFESLEARYPYGRYAQQAQLEVAYAYYKQGEQASAVAAVDRFIKLHPDNPNVDYAYYLKGLTYFNEDLGLFSRFSAQDPTERDPKSTGESFDAFKELVQRFPQSKYSPDALARMKYLVNALASHEIHVARYYLKRGAYIAAVNRAQFVLKNYPQAPALEEALVIMVQAYDALDMSVLRDDAKRILKKNFPDSRSFADVLSRLDG